MWLAIVGVLALVSPVVHAAAGPAEVSFAEGKRLFSQGKYEGACRKFEESHRLEPTIGARYHMAQCHERLGRSASAWAGYLEVAVMARARGQLSREKVARDRATELEPKLVRLMIEVANSSTQGLTIRRNDVPIQKSDWNLAVPVDPGAYVLEATAPDHLPWRGTIDVAPTKPSWEAHVPELTPVGQPEPEPAVVPDLRVSPLPPPPPKSSSGSSTTTTTRIVALSAAAGSVLAFGASGYFTVSAIQNNDAADPHCRGSMCDPTGAGLRSDAVAASDVSTGLAITGGVLAVTGALFWLLGPARTERR